MNPHTELTGHDTNVGLSREILISEAAYKVVTAIERAFRLLLAPSIGGLSP